MKPMMTLLVDMDGVLADFDGPLFERYGHHLNCTRETQKHRFLTDHLPTREMQQDMRRLVESKGWFYSLPLVEGAREGMEYLQSLDHVDLWICSKPLEASPTCASEKFAWIDDHFPEMRGRLILAPDKSMVAGDYLLDDAIKPSWIHRADWDPIVFDHPWNRRGPLAHDTRHRFALRMGGWSDVQEMFPR